MDSSLGKFADYILATMVAKGLNQEQVAERSRGGITSSYISRIRSGAAYNPSVKKLCSLARGLGIREEELFSAAIGHLPREAETTREIQALILLRQLPPERQDDAIAYLSTMAGRYQVEPTSAVSTQAKGSHRRRVA